MGYSAQDGSFGGEHGDQAWDLGQSISGKTMKNPCVYIYVYIYICIYIYKYVIYIYLGKL